MKDCFGELLLMIAFEDFLMMILEDCFVELFWMVVFVWLFLRIVLKYCFGGLVWGVVLEDWGGKSI